MIRAIQFLTALVLILVSAAPAGADLNLDPAFGTGGIVRTAFGAGNIDTPRDLLVLPDGRILAAGQSAGGANAYFIAMARCAADGAIDSGFGMEGMVLVQFELQDYVNAIAVQGDGRIVAAGLEANTNVGSAQTPSVYRFLPDGQVDTGFGSGGRSVHRYDAISSGEHADVALLPDGRIVAGGRCNANANGGTAGFGRKTFLSDGTQSASIRRDFNILFDRGSCAFTPGGGVLWANTAFLNGRSELVLAQVDSSGNPDTILGPGGILQTGIPAQNGRDLKVMILSSGKILLGASTPRNTFFERFTVFRFHANGTPDDAFGLNGRVDIDFTTGFDTFHDMTLDAEGRILVVGEARMSSTQSALARLLPDGEPDLTFGPGGQQVLSLGGPDSFLTQVTVLPDGKILVAGSDYFDFILARFGAPTSAAPAMPPDRIRLTVFPNPARGAAAIDLRLPRDQDVTIIVVDIAGRFVQRLFSGSLPAGTHLLRWNGRDEAGNEARTGAYFLKAATPSLTVKEKLIRVR